MIIRLICISLASFFLIHAAVGLLVSFTAPLFVRLAERLRPNAAARLLLTMRLLPAGFALMAVALLCVPSYMLLEPKASAETIGWPCLAMAALCLAVWGISIGRTVRIAKRSSHYVAQCRKTSQEAHVGASPVWVIDAQAPLMALSGILKPRLLMSRNVIGSLSKEEIAAAVRHESAHRESLDNLKRLIMMITPGILPFANGFGALERGWSRFTEWAADDRAVGGDAECSLALASALVRVSRLGAAAKSSLLATSLIGDRSDLQSRVDRLVSATVSHEPSSRWPVVAIVCGAVVASGSLLRLMTDPATLSSVHGLLEFWMQ